MHVEEYKIVSNAEVQRVIGERLKQERLNQNLTQVDLAKQCGVSRRTLVGAERGEGSTLDTLISILRGLGILHRLVDVIPPAEPSPIQLAKLKGKRRQRASSKPKEDTLALNDKAETWEWKE